MEIPAEIKHKLKLAKVDFPDAVICYNATTESFFINYFSANYYSSIFIVRL